MCFYDKQNITWSQEVMKFFSRVQLDVWLVRCARSWAIELNARKEIPYLRTPVYYSPFITRKYFVEIPQCITSSTSGFSENVTHYDFPLHVYHQRHSFIALYHGRETKSESFASCRVWVNIFGGSEKFSVNVRHPLLEVLLLRFCELNFRKMKSSNWKL